MTLYSLLRTLIHTTKLFHRNSVAIVSETVGLSDFVSIWPSQMATDNIDVLLSGADGDNLAAQFIESNIPSPLRVTVAPMDMKSRSSGEYQHVLNLVVWVMSQTALPIALSVIANFFTARYFRSSKITRDDPVTITLAYESGGKIEKISLTGPPRLIAKKINTTQFLRKLTKR
jgi:hypothetical protein